MQMTLQITRVIENIIKKLKGDITTKGTAQAEFKEYHKIFNALKYSQKKFIIIQIMYSRGRLIRYGVENKFNVHLEGLGTFKYKSDREEFLSKLSVKLKEHGYNVGDNIPRDLKEALIDEVNGVMTEKRMSNYFEKIKTNREKRIKPVPLSINLSSITRK